MAVVCGEISGGLEILDLDNWDVVEPWKTRVDELLPGLLNRLVQVKTPRPGLHVYYRCQEIQGNQKLARVPFEDADTGKLKPKTIIEGEGGYCLAPGSPRNCHARNLTYQFMGDHDLTQVTTITPEERRLLFQAAEEFNEWEDPKPKLAKPRSRKHANHGDRPGDEFNAKAQWADILQPHGWRCMSVSEDGTESWRRPGKTGPGCSATVNYGQHDCLYVFSANAYPFDEATGYSKFHAFVLLEYDGDFAAAAKELVKRGYGQTQLSRMKTSKRKKRRRQKERRSRFR